MSSLKIFQRKTFFRKRLSPSVKRRVFCPLEDQSIRGERVLSQANTGEDQLELTSKSPKAESEKELKSLLMKAKEKNEKASLKINIQKTKIMASSIFRIERKSTLNIHWKDWCQSWSSNSLAIWCKELSHWNRPWCWERLRAGGEGGHRGWDDWMDMSLSKLQELVKDREG